MGPKRFFPVHRRSPPVPILSQISPSRDSQTHFMKIHLNIFIQSTPGCCKCFVPSGPRTRTLYTPLLSPIHATCPAHLILLDLITGMIFGEDAACSSPLCSPLPCHLVPLKPKYLSQHPILQHPPYVHPSEWRPICFTVTLWKMKALCS